MKKSLILLLFLKFLIIKSVDDEFLFKAKCEKEKAKTGACFYEIEDSKGNEEYALFDNCGKGKICGSDRVCVDKIELRKNGKSCNYDNDCLSNLCISNKCSLAKEGDKCDNNIKCEVGLTCYSSYSSGKYLKICTQPAKEGSKMDKTNCMYGLAPDKDSICKKYGSLPDKTVIPHGSVLLCESGLAHDNSNYEYVCDSLENEPECEDNKVKKAGKWSDGTEIPVYNPNNYNSYYSNGCRRETDYTGKDKDYYENSKLQSKLYKEFINEYNKLDLDKFNSEEGSSFNKGKIGEKYLLYQNAPALQAAGIIDSQGNVVDDKKCIFDYIVKEDNSIFIKLKPIIIAIISLLF